MRNLFNGTGTLAFVVAILLGVLAGLSAFTFGYGEGHSYLSDNPTACVNCHIMQPQYDSWIKSSHAARATCNDCHVPNEFFRKWVAKADNGFFHSWAFTFQNFHEPIQIKRRNLDILENNCVRCHEFLVDQILALRDATANTSCMECHHSVGHAARTAGMPRRMFAH